MTFNNENILFDLPVLSYQWQHRGILYFDILNNTFLLLNKENKKTELVYLCKVTIFHTTMGDIHTFNVKCNDLSTHSSNFENLIFSIFEKYCSENIIELKFDNFKND